MVDYGEDLFQRIVGVHWRKKVPSGTLYANRAIIVTDAHPANVHVTKNGWNWDDMGDLGYAGTGWGEGLDASSISFGGYRRDNKKFAVSGARQDFNGATADPAVDFDMASNDGYDWSPSGSNMNINLNWSYSGGERVIKDPIELHPYVYRVAGGGVGNTDSRFGHVDNTRFLAPKYPRRGGDVIQRCANPSAMEDDDSQRWETIFDAGTTYFNFGPIQVIKGDGPDDAPTLLCVCSLGDPDRKFGVLASRGGAGFTLTFQGHVILHGGADCVGFSAARVSTI
jgi:hypothetical protein